MEEDGGHVILGLRCRLCISPKESQRTLPLSRKLVRQLSPTRNICLIEQSYTGLFLPGPMCPVFPEDFIPRRSMASNVVPRFVCLNTEVPPLLPPGQAEMETEANSQLQGLSGFLGWGAPAQTSTRSVHSFSLVHVTGLGSSACLSVSEFTRLSGWSVGAVLGLRGSDVLEAVMSAVHRLLVGGGTQ